MGGHQFPLSSVFHLHMERPADPYRALSRKHHVDALDRFRGGTRGIIDAAPLFHFSFGRSGVLRNKEDCP
ncbi:hypothetical protein [Mesorhizobium sp. B2-3-15]|uniref:hypothetical protein n=1 Tax=Mesorhizobium sp. B2-3-15 TaxID=2589949 RepID=UPI00112BFE01|nr:hypothetical protein [Mesorhizobium sp. B2-3-15]TPL74801.1 hypothetical protein FJ954_07380 [Mesorhizobium sp. B2-3-15]